MNVYVPIQHELFAGRSLDDALLDTGGVLEMRLEDGNGATVYVRFDDYLVYRKRDEGDSYRTLQELERVATFKIGIYRVEESEFLRWFGEECAHIQDVTKLKHFCLATLNSIIDVISLDEPEIRAGVGTDQKASPNKRSDMGCSPACRFAHADYGSFLHEFGSDGGAAPCADLSVSRLKPADFCAGACASPIATDSHVACRRGSHALCRRRICRTWRIRQRRRDLDATAPLHRGRSAAGAGGRAEALDCGHLRIPPLRREAGLGLPVRRHRGGADAGDLEVLSGARAARALRLSFSLHARRAGGAARGRLETWEEAKVILVYHLVGTAMELFKTATGSWIYPEPSLFRLGGVPLFSGFMYSCIGSYLCRVWRLFDFRFTDHPQRRWLIRLSALIYLNFFLDHYGFDLRLLLFVLAALLIGPATVHFRAWLGHGPVCQARLVVSAADHQLHARQPDQPAEGDGGAG